MKIRSNVDTTNELKCEWRGNVRNLSEHLQMFQSKFTKNKKANECPLKHLGYGYLNAHYKEYNEQHSNYIIQCFENMIIIILINYNNLKFK